MESSTAAPVTHAAPVAVTSDSDLGDQLLRLAAAVGVPLDVVSRAADVPGPLSARAGLLADGGAVEELLARPADRRLRTAVICPVSPPETLWRQAVALRAERVLTLPGDDEELLEWLVDVTDTPRATAVMVAVIGGRGGAGASTLAAGMAKAAGRHRGDDVFLVDLDPLGGGLELLLGCEDVPGLRWPEVASTRGRISPVALRDALPRDDGVALLSWPRDGVLDVPESAVPGVLQSMRRGADLVIVDLPRHVDERARAAIRSVDTVLVVGTADVRGAAGAARIVETVRADCNDIRLVVRRGRGSSITPDAIAASLGVPLVGRLPNVRGQERAISEGLGPPLGGAWGRACRQLLRGIATPVAAT
jgi:secretion/DNA translocation related CpaE-like protein